jgi:hypothetical protein
MKDYSYVYPERTRLREDRTYLDMSTGEVRTQHKQGLPVFPDTCPVCGAATVPHPKAETHGRDYHPIAYACGGSYDHKPQIQNHTDKWWGTCPARKAAIDRAEEGV